MRLVTLMVLLLWSTNSNTQSLEPIEAFDECPARGTVVSDAPYCGSGLGRWSKWEKVANGQCGTYRRVVEKNSVECGYTPDEPVCPIRGTDLEINYCGDPEGTYFTRGSPDNLYTRIANGTCGSWRRTIEVDSPKCAPVLEVEEVNTVGDRFESVVFNVSYYQGYNVMEWDYEITDSTIGHVTKTPHQVIINGDGRLGDGVITIQGEEYAYTMKEEPRCDAPRTFSSGYTEQIDCENYRFSGPAEGYIYYGPDDKRIVYWEWVVMWASSSLDTAYEKVERGTIDYDRAEDYVRRMNLILERSRVYARIKLVGVARGPSGLTINTGALNRLGIPKFDALAQEGATYPNTCGVAYGTQYINKTPRTWLSACGVNTALHEFGHTVGLNHGPYNTANAGTGFMFPDFGHGHYTRCINHDDIMSYSSYGDYFANSEVTCLEMWGDVNPKNQPDIPSGIRNGTAEEDIGDTAYAINRVRYDVALIHDEWETLSFDGLEYIEVYARPVGTLIID